MKKAGVRHCPRPKIRQSILPISCKRGFSPNNISVLFRTKTGTRDFAHEQHTKAPEGAARRFWQRCGAYGGSLGRMLGSGALAIPGLGPFIAAGPIMAALAGAGAGAAAGGLAGAPRRNGYS